MPAALSGCPEPSSPIGPPGTLQLLRSGAPDSTIGDGFGRLVAFFHWSSDSLARKAQPPTVRFQLTSIAVRYDSGGYASVTDTSGFGSADSRASAATLQAPEGSYRFQVHALGAISLDTTVAIRRGFTDTARVSLQAGGIPLCGIGGMAPNMRLKLRAGAAAW